MDTLETDHRTPTPPIGAEPSTATVPSRPHAVRPSRRRVVPKAASSRPSHARKTADTTHETCGSSEKDKALIAGYQKAEQSHTDRCTTVVNPADGLESIETAKPNKKQSGQRRCQILTVLLCVWTSLCLSVPALEIGPVVLRTFR